MRIAMNDHTVEPFSSTHPTTGESASADIVEALQELLSQSIHLRDIYKNARWQTAEFQFHRLRELFDGHYKEQIRLVDVLIDRLRELNGAAKVFAGDFLFGALLSPLVHGRRSTTSVLVTLIDAHESVLNTAQPIQTDAGRVYPIWTGDFSVGQVVLSNDLQLFAVRNLWIDRQETPPSQSTPGS